MPLSTLTKPSAGNVWFAGIIPSKPSSFIIAALFIIVILALIKRPARSNVPLVNGRSSLFNNEFRVSTFGFGYACLILTPTWRPTQCPQKLYQRNLKGIMDGARARYPNQVYRVASDNGDAIVIMPYTYADEIRSNPHLSFTKFFHVVCIPPIPYISSGLTLVLVGTPDGFARFRSGSYNGRSRS